jgi:hypothetical protein
MATLSSVQRKALPKSNFVFPGKAPGAGSYPIPNVSHAKSALSLGSRFAGPAGLKKIKAKVKKKFPSMRVAAMKQMQMSKPDKEFAHK